MVPVGARADTPPRFEWKVGDRVVLIGDDLIEREQKSGYLETLITIQNPDKTVMFRNLGWSGDTPYGIARAGFGKPEDGYRHLIDHVLALKPTVLIVGYGMTDSFDGKAGLDRFKAGMNQLLDDLASTRARVVLLSPIAHEDLGPPLPSPAAHNEALRLYCDTLREIAGQRNAWFIDLLDATLDASPPRDRNLAYTDDGIHLNRRGYKRASLAIAERLSRNIVEPFAHEPERVEIERLRQVIVEKNWLYFYRWRPQNETYLFGFRKHEQGNNAREIPLFDPLVEAMEKEIARLKVPASRLDDSSRQPEDSKP
jgi:lysophospholipase L1-like esterase